MVNVIGFEVDGQTRPTIPEAGETIEEIVVFDPDVLNSIKSIKIYQRDKDACPWALGNWIIDIFLFDGKVFCLRLPLEMTKEHVLEYCKPLYDALDNIRERL